MPEYICTSRVSVNKIWFGNVMCALNICVSLKISGMHMSSIGLNENLKNKLESQFIVCIVTRSLKWA